MAWSEQGGALADECCTKDEAGSSLCSVRVPQPDTRQGSAGCPACTVLGKPVQTQTVQALLSGSLREVQNEAYRFCRTPACPVVYYTEDGTAAFALEQVRERVYQKESADPNVFVCYCFRYTVRDVADAGAEGRKMLIQDISRGIQAGQCACNLRNLQGSCCLGNVRSLISQFEAAEASVWRI